MSYLEKINDVMQQSGDFLMKHFRQKITWRKKDDGSVVTDYDLENEQFLKFELGKIKAAGFYAEESGVIDQQDYMWVIDPIDGTRNFLQGLPHFCVSIALTYKQDPIVAATYHPVTKDLFFAEKNKGAYLAGKKLSISAKNDDTEQLLLIVNKKMARMIGGNFHMRILGSAALDLAYVAAGYVDGVVTGPLKWWDVAAGKLLVAEAGGKIIEFSKKKSMQHSSKALVAGSLEVCDMILPFIQGKI